MNRQIRIKRAYEKPSPQDGARFLVDRLWPRGRKKEELELRGWLKELAPSSELRSWFKHEPGKWSEFRRRYLQELEQKSDTIRSLLDSTGNETVTLVYAARNREQNNAVVLKEFLDEWMEPHGS